MWQMPWGEYSGLAQLFILHCKQLHHTLLLEVAQVTSIDQFRYIKIKPKTIDFSNNGT